MTSLTRRSVALSLVACCLVFAAPARGQDEDKTRAMRRHLINAVKAFENERYDEAVRQFEEVLKLSPSSADALALRDLASMRFYVQAMSKGTPAMRKNVLELLELAARAEKARFTDQEEIAKRIARLTGPFEERSRVYLDLMSAGRYAVPLLVDRLYNVKAEDYAAFRVQVMISLIRISEEAVLPLCVALRADSIPVRQDICFVLGQIGDPRAAPYLLQLAKSDPDASVRMVAEEALAKIRTFADIPDEPPPVALFRHARLYYYEDPSVRRPNKYGHTVWNWSVKRHRLVIQAVPAFLYDVSMARQVAAQALLADANYEPVLPFLIGTYHKEALLIEDHLRESKGAGAVKLSELEQRQLGARLTKCRQVLLTLRSAGERHFYRALSLQLHDDDSEVAVAIIEDLAVVADKKLNTYSELSALTEPLRAAVVTIRTPEEAEATAAELASKKAEEAPVATPRVTAAALFHARVETEMERVKAAEPEKAATIKAAPPALRATLNQLIATARRSAARRSEKAEAKVDEAKPEALASTANPLLLALRNSNKNVRYGAAAAIVRIQPTENFGSAQTVVKILGQALTERGVSAALIVSADNQATNVLRQVIRKAGHIPYSAASVEMILATARALPPKNAIIIQDTMSEAFAALKRDPVIAAIPFIVFTKEKDTAAAKATYGAGAVSVVSLAGDIEKAGAQIVDTIAAGRLADQASAPGARYAQVGARALDAIPAAGSPLSPHLAVIKPAFISALDSDDRNVRITAIHGLGKAKVMSLIPRLIDLAQNKSRPIEERLACIAAIGETVEPGKPTPDNVVKLVLNIHESADSAFRVKALALINGAAIPAADVEKIINEQESDNPAADAAPAPVKNAPKDDEPEADAEEDAPEKDAAE